MTGGVNDQFFNQIAYSGVKKAAELFQWETALIESTMPIGLWQEHSNVRR